MKIYNFNTSKHDTSCFLSIEEYRALEEEFEKEGFSSLNPLRIAQGSISESSVNSTKWAIDLAKIIEYINTKNKFDSIDELKR